MHSLRIVAFLFFLVLPLSSGQFLNCPKTLLKLGAWMCSFIHVFMTQMMLFSSFNGFGGRIKLK